ncbi:MAG: hypothetical protein ACOYOV_10250 [Bacteroidales bacterium]
MKKEYIIGILVILILAVIAFMVNDLFLSKSNQDNPYELSTDSLKKLDPNLIGYKEISQIQTAMDELNGIAIDKNDNIIVAGSKLIIYNQKYKEIKSCKLDEISNCIAVNSNNEIFMGVQSHVEVRNMQGELLRRWKCVNNESILTGIAVDNENVFVANAAERLLHQYDVNGKFINNIGKEDSLNGVPAVIIRSPFFDVAIGRDNEIWMVNPGMYQLEAFDKKGNMKSSWGKPSDEIDGFCGCCNPTNIALLSDGSFVCSEKAIPRVKIYSQSGVFSCVVAGPNQFEDGTKGLDLAVDSKNRIYVLDPVRKQIRVFEKK